MLLVPVSFRGGQARPREFPGAILAGRGGQWYFSKAAGRPRGSPQGSDTLAQKNRKIHAHPEIDEHQLGG